jgi:flagellar export protein FliJ
MPISRSLSRLLRVREIEEEQRRLALESAQQELLRLETALAAAGERDRQGRALVTASARSGNLPDRLAGLEESRASKRHLKALSPRIAESEEVVEERREEFLEKRIERRQVETLIEESESREAVEEGRRGQQNLDAWFGGRKHHAALVAERIAARPVAPPSNTAEGHSSKAKPL